MIISDYRLLLSEKKQQKPWASISLEVNLNEFVPSQHYHCQNVWHYSSRLQQWIQMEYYLQKFKKKSELMN